jgi:hypothetical protein
MPVARTIAAQDHVIGRRSKRNPDVRNMLGMRPAPGGTDSTESATYRSTAASLLAITIGLLRGYVT